MQKLIQIYKPNKSDLDDINNVYLSDGWKIKNMTGINSELILLLEKETRKEKLEELDSIAKQ